MAIAGATYYVASGAYYRPVYQGSEVTQDMPARGWAGILTLKIKVVEKWISASA